MRAALVGVVTALAVGTSGVYAQQQLQFYASVQDAAGAPVATLEPTDISILENGSEAKIVNIEPVTWTSKVALILDNGSGMGEHLSHIRNGARGFIEALPAGVEASIQTTAPNPRFIIRPTTDKGQLLGGVDRIAPDTGAARFTDALVETAKRFDSEKSELFLPTVVILGSQFAEGSQIRERDVQRMIETYARRRATVHVVMVSVVGRSATGGAVQAEIGQITAQNTGGRFETISAASRIATLLPEIGEQVGKSVGRQGKQFRITVQRPAGATGPMGQIGFKTRGGLTTALSLDGRIP